MAIRAFTGFELGATNDVEGTTGTVSIVTSPVKTGAYALRTNPTTTGTGYFKLRATDAAGAWSMLGSEMLFLAFDFRVDVLPATGNELIVWLYTSGSNYKGSLRINADGTLAVYDGSYTLKGTAATGLSTGVWYRIVFQYGHWNPDVIRVWVDGTLVIDTTGNCAPSYTHGTAYIGKVQNLNSNSVDYYFDNVILDDAEKPRDDAVVRIFPADGNGTYTAWIIGSGSGEKWTLVDDVGVDTTYLYSGLTLGYAFTSTHQAASDAGLGAVVLGVTQSLHLYAGTGGSSVLSRIRSNNTDYDSDAYAIGSGAMAYPRRYLLTDPATGVAWTFAGLDALESGAVCNNESVQARMYRSILQVLSAPSGTVPAALIFAPVGFS